MGVVCGLHAASLPLGKKLPQQGGGKKNRMGRHVDYMPPPSSLTTQEKKPPQRGGVNEVKRGGGVSPTRRPHRQRSPPNDGGVNEWEWGGVWVTHAAPHCRQKFGERRRRRRSPAPPPLPVSPPSACIPLPSSLCHLLAGTIRGDVALGVGLVVVVVGWR